MAKTKHRSTQPSRRPDQPASENQRRRTRQETPVTRVDQSGKIVPETSQEETTTQNKQERVANTQRPITSRATARAQTRYVQQRYQKKRRSPLLFVGITVVIIAAIIGLFMFLANQGSSDGRKPTSTGVLQAINNVDPAILEAVSTGGLKNPIVATQGKPPLLNGPTGKPEFFYEGAEYCPYCAAERWATAVALSHFGKFTKLPETTSASDDAYPNTATLSFYGSSYTSSYIDFVPLEETTNQRDSTGNYATLQKPTAAQTKLINTYNGPPYTNSPGIPFISIANQYLELGPAYDPTSLAGLSQQTIAADLSNSSSPVAKNVLGGANYLTAAICTTTNNQPSSVCTTGAIPTIEQSLPKTQATTQQVPDTSTRVAMEPGAFIGRREG